jgi:hypothetical protein
MRISHLATGFLFGCLPATLMAQQSTPFDGRWDLTLVTAKGSRAQWMEVTHKDGAPAVRIQPPVGSVHEASDVRITGNRLTLTAAPANANRPQVSWEIEAEVDSLNGTACAGTDALGKLTGRHAPLLDRKPPAHWTNAEPLFDGNGLSKWQPTDPANNHWKVQTRELVNGAAGANLRTTRTFDDFKLHVEYNCPEGGNSGIYLRGRYEVQIEYEPPGTNDSYHSMGAIYGFISPGTQLPRKPGQWETYDITLVGRQVTVVRDGTTIIENQEIPGITGGALDSNESEPGPILLQGDHSGGLRFRNITVATPRR